MKRNLPAQSNNVARWKVQAECKNLHADLLSARCIVDRLRLQFGPRTVAESTERRELEKVAANLLVIASFVQSIEEVLSGVSSYDEDQGSESRNSS